MFKDFIVFDTETTGLSSKSDLLLEMAALKVVNNRVVGSFDAFVYHDELHIPPDIVQLTRISEEMIWLYGINEKLAIEKFLHFMGNLPIAGHNVRFDYDFLMEACSRWKIDCGHIMKPRKQHDTLWMSRRYLPAIRHNLSTLVEYFGLDSSGAHRALADCMMTYNVLQRIRQLPEYKPWSGTGLIKSDGDDNPNLVHTTAEQVISGNP